MLALLEKICYNTDVCKLDANLLMKELGLSLTDVYIEIERLKKGKYISVFDENGTTYVKVR